MRSLLFYKNLLKITDIKQLNIHRNGINHKLNTRLTLPCFDRAGKVPDK